MSDSEPVFGLSEVGQISIPVEDLERATRFYREALGMRFLFSAPNMSFFDCGGIRLMLAIPEGNKFSPPGSILYYRVQDMASAHETLRGRGVKFVSEPHVVHATEEMELWMAFFRDVDQNFLALMCEKSISE